MKKTTLLCLIVIITLLTLGCDNSVPTTHTPNIQEPQPPKTALTKGNINSYLDVYINFDSTVSFLNYNENTNKFYGNIDSKIEVCTRPKKSGTFENVKIEVRCYQNSWDSYPSEKLEGNFYVTVPIDGNTNRTFSLNASQATARQVPNLNPPYYMQIKSVSGTFVEK